MRNEPAKILTEVVAQLSMAADLHVVTQIVAKAARELAGSDGSTFVLREDDKCYYLDEYAISPLWKGKRFPLELCISGWSMYHKQVVVIPDIYKDARVPQEAYRPTFVKSLCLVPIRIESPMGVIGNYWADGYCPDEEEIKLLQILANSTAITLENLHLKEDIIKRNNDQVDFKGQQKQMENALHTMAHDLKSPLSTMMLFADLLQTKLADSLDEKMKGYFDSIIKTGEGANQQIRKMLSLYSVTNKKIDVTKVNLSSLGYELAEYYRGYYPDHNIEVIVDREMYANVDPHLVRIVIDNLLSNAFKYTSKTPNAKIHFGFHSADEKYATYFVKDNGAGFENSESGKLFKPLVRLHNDSDFFGTGMGLASVARIVELHGGRVWAKGEPQNGATFFFTLPT